MPVPEPKHQQIMEELIALQAQDSQCNLSQFRSITSAEQYQKLYQLLQQCVAPKSAVLDWGCGNGHFSYFLARSDYQAYGYAFDDFYLRQKLNQFAYEFKQGTPTDAIAIPYKDQQFDAVVSVGVLEHVRETGGDELASLKEIFRLLKPGGYFICYHLPNQFSWIDPIAALVPNKHHHLYRYTRKSIYALCQTAGYELLDVQRYGILPRNFWGNLPKSIGTSAAIAQGWHLADTTLSYIFSPFCQNYWFVAQKPSDSHCPTA
ncbi:MAG TPA: class I SAM-dependent methyltransferase [Candidatus Obscuribacterales bacterium]